MVQRPKAIIPAEIRNERIAFIQVYPISRLTFSVQLHKGHSNMRMSKQPGLDTTPVMTCEVKEIASKGLRTSTIVGRPMRRRE
jgi:hypothetical protein